MHQKYIAVPIVIFCAFICSQTAFSQIFSYARLGNGVLINAPAEEAAKTIKVEAISDKIIHVTAYPGGIVPDKSLMVVESPTISAPTFNVSQDGNDLILETASLTVKASLINGSISFADRFGKAFVKEMPGSRILEQATYQGESSFKIGQTFSSTTDEAYYGLGQHQAGLINYKDQHVDLLQNNTEVAVPFVVSSKNYGILWDNYSITKVSDTRNYLPLSAFKLYSKNDEEGWLTASYSSLGNPSKEPVMKAESDINYLYLNDMPKFPKEINLSDSKVIWEGQIESPYTGLHNLFTRYSGYIKVWIDGKLLMDKYRQSWNSGSEITSLNFEKGKKYPIKIEWLPGSSESFIALHWLNPLPENKKDQFGFASEAGDAINYYFISGNNADEVISGYRQLTGKATMMPKWAMGFWQSRERYKTQDEILTTIKELRSRKIPIDNIVLDWSYWKQDQWGSQEFDETRFSDPAGMVKQLHDQYHTHIMISVWAKFYEGIEAYKNFDKNGWLYKRNIANRQRDWIGRGYVSTFYDAFNPQARVGFWDLMNTKLYSKGIDAWWMDASEPDIHSNLDIDARKNIMNPTYLGSATKYYNAFPFENAKGIYEGQRKTNPNDRVFILTRSAYAGQQRFAAATWSGDIASRWEDMKAQIPAGINFSLSGIPYWTMDVGGFSVERRYEKPNDKDLEEWRELNARWYQFGAFVPLFRAHGQFPFREIYNIAPESHPAYKSILYYNKLRYRLMPYIYSLVGKAYQEDYTLMRGLIMDFATDNEVKNIADQYMFGPSLLINPVYEYHAASRQVYLPAGEGWFDLNSNKFYKGGQNVTAAAPYERMPIFVKAGSIIPVGPEIQYTAEKPGEPVTLYVYAGKDALFTLYDDEGTNYNYEKGAFEQIQLSYNETSRALTIGSRKGSYAGMQKNRVFHVILINPSAPKIIDFTQPETGKTVNYTGNAITIKL